MSYYMGDTYRGDYGRGSGYKGDPGLLSFVGKAARGLAGVVTHGLSEKLVRAVPIFRATKPPPPGPMRQTVMALGGTGPGTLTPAVYDGGPVGGGGQLPMLPPHHRALHWNKATYVTRGGGTSRWPQQLLVHPKETEPVPSRRMNVSCGQTAIP